MEEEKQNGEIKAVSQKNKSVLIEHYGGENWFKLDEKIKPEFLKKGECEFIVENGLIKYIRNIIEKNIEKIENIEKEDIEEKMEEEIKRMSALKYASMIYQGTGKEGEKDFKKLVGNIGYFIETGAWKE